MDVMDVMAWNVLDARYPCFLLLAHILPLALGSDSNVFFSSFFLLLSTDVFYDIMH